MSTHPTPAPPPTIAAAIDRYADPVRAQLTRLRALVLETAVETVGVGRIEEALKWGQPSFLTPDTGAGSTVRIDAVNGSRPSVAVYFHCQTDLVSTFRQIYPDTFEFEANRALHLDAGRPLPETELKHCISLALTYHLRKKRKAAT